MEGAVMKEVVHFPLISLVLGHRSELMLSSKESLSFGSIVYLCANNL